MAKSMARRYAKAIRDDAKLVAAWPIGTAIQLGDVGFLGRSKLFERRANLSDFGVTFDVSSTTQAIDSNVTQAKGFSMRFKAAGEAPCLGSQLTAAEAGVSILLGRGSSVIVRAHTTESAIRNLHDLESNLIRLAQDDTKRWQKDYVVVTSVYKSTGTTVLLSSTRNATIDITANVGVATPFDLAEAGIGLAAMSGCERFISALAQAEFVPFFQIHHLIGRNSSGLCLRMYGKAA